MRQKKNIIDSERAGAPRLSRDHYPLNIPAALRLLFAHKCDRAQSELRPSSHEARRRGADVGKGVRRCAGTRYGMYADKVIQYFRREITRSCKPPAVRTHPWQGYDLFFTTGTGIGHGNTTTRRNEEGSEIGNKIRIEGGSSIGFESETETGIERRSESTLEGAIQLHSIEYDPQTASAKSEYTLEKNLFRGRARPPRALAELNKLYFSLPACGTQIYVRHANLSRAGRRAPAATPDTQADSAPAQLSWKVYKPGSMPSSTARRHRNSGRTGRRPASRSPIPFRHLTAGGGSSFANIPRPLPPALPRPLLIAAAPDVPHAA
ncbi:hypothetical protein EVAR_10839_1 [Eumeta japonica]|uniref:Uncharacterized protein n=1 Tax=Eumeta variegata TaxID=151549 RepID=A0A4C1UT73_EUMVA|nr:hypothetical protein EVAR_10839_1 [Eumeta japonica]